MLASVWLNNGERRPANRGLTNETKNNDFRFPDQFRLAWPYPNL
jgi:hypothetical protein